MDQNELKAQVAVAALEFVPDDVVVGVGTGSTTNFFIDALAQRKARIRATVASSEATAERLRKHGLTVLELNAVEDLPVYIDGADEITARFAMIKGGGGALTREKIVAAVAKRFICIADESKLVATLGRYPLPVEVIPMARAFVARELIKRGGDPRLRTGFTTDNGNQILDVHGLTITEPERLEADLNQIAGVVTNGLFALRGADVLLLGTAQGVRISSRG